MPNSRRVRAMAWAVLAASAALACVSVSFLVCGAIGAMPVAPDGWCVAAMLVGAAMGTMGAAIGAGVLVGTKPDRRRAARGGSAESSRRR